MKEIKFLLKTNKDDRDCVKYIQFEDDGKFGFTGACFWGMSYQRDEILDNYNEITTALTKEELQRLFEMDKGFERTQENLDFINHIKNKLDSDLAKDLWSQVQEEEREYLYDEYGLDYNDIEDIFDNYERPYRDRGIVCCVWDSTYDIGENYVNNCCDIESWLERYIDYERIGDDMVENNYNNEYFRLDDGRIVELSY